jgi:chemotaxis protein methyltransferase CheR
MPFYRDILGLPDSAFALLRNLIHERTGLFYENGKSDLLTDKLSPLVIERGFNSFLDYYYLLKYDTRTDDEWRRVIDALSVQETYFWREMDQVRALVDVLVPKHFAAHPTLPLRIWSAACATGEEPLTIAMALDEKGWFDRAPIEIYASDASPSALAKARRGVYRERSFRSLPPRLRAKYFIEEPGTWRVLPELLARVKWRLANLVVEADVAPLASAPIIFCRNVFIYFSQDSLRKVVNLFSRAMPTPGYLFVGASESLLRLATDFDFQEIGGAFVYVKD